MNDKESLQNIIDMPSNGEIERSELSFPSEFPAGELPDEETAHLELEYPTIRKGEIGQPLSALTTEFGPKGKPNVKLDQHSQWNNSYTDENKFEGTDKLGTEDGDTDSLSEAVYEPYASGTGPIESRYENADKNKHNIILHASEEDEKDIDPDVGPENAWIAVDLDGTILESPPDSKYEITGVHQFGEPLPGAKEALQEMVDGGARVSIYTARQFFADSDEEENKLKEAVEDVLTLHDIPFSDVYIGKKAPFHHFIDDRAVTFDGDWDFALDAIRDQLIKTANDSIKDTTNYKGIEIDIEWPKGSIRSYEGEDTYVTYMECSYGYVRGIDGSDGEELDIYLGDEDSDIVFVIEQVKDDGSYDEDKIMLGFNSEEDAVDMYLQHMPAFMLGDIRTVSVEKLVNALNGEPEDRRGEEDQVLSEEKSAGFKYMASKEPGEHVGLFIPLPADLAEQYPIEGREGEDDSDPHMTLLYIGDVSEDKFDELISVIKESLQGISSFELSLLPPESFKNKEDQEIIHSPLEIISDDIDLTELHNILRRNIEDANFEVKAHKEFKPHITIEYVNPNEESKFKDIQPTGSWLVDEIEIWGLGDPHIIKLDDESGMYKLPDGSGFFTGVVGNKKIKIASKINFSTHEISSLKERISNDKPIYTTRMDKELGKYKVGKLYDSPFGELSVIKIDKYTSLDEHPFLDELTSKEKKRIGSNEYELVKLKKKAKKKNIHRKTKSDYVGPQTSQVGGIGGVGVGADKESSDKESAHQEIATLAINQAKTNRELWEYINPLIQQYQERYAEDPYDPSPESGYDAPRTMNDIDLLSGIMIQNPEITQQIESLINTSEYVTEHTTSLTEDMPHEEKLQYRDFGTIEQQIEIQKEEAKSLNEKLRKQKLEDPVKTKYERSLEKTVANKEVGYMKEASIGNIALLALNESETNLELKQLIDQYVDPNLDYVSRVDEFSRLLLGNGLLTDYFVQLLTPTLLSMPDKEVREKYLQAMPMDTRIEYLNTRLESLKDRLSPSIYDKYKEQIFNMSATKTWPDDPEDEEKYTDATETRESLDIPRNPEKERLIYSNS